MDSSKKIPWNSSTKFNDNETTGIYGNSRDALSRFHQHQPMSYEQKISQSEVTNRLKSLSEAINETSVENAVLGKEVSNLLFTLELEPHLLSREVRDGVDKVNTVLKGENLSEVNETALVINMEQRRRDELLESREDKEFKKKYEELCSQYTSLEEKLRKVQEKVSSLTELINVSRLDDEDNHVDVIHNTTRLNDYKQTCNHLDEEMANMQLTDDYQDQILGKYKKYLEATVELADVNKLLNQYGHLPPDIVEAKAFLEEREKRRQELKRLLDEKLN